MTGLLAPSAELTIEITTQEEKPDNKEAEKFVTDNWNYGPAQENDSDYWRRLSKLWRISPEQAKRSRCSNCEYFNNSPEELEMIEEAADKGCCEKWEFTADANKVCQAWENRNEIMG